MDGLIRELEPVSPTAIYVKLPKQKRRRATFPDCCDQPDHNDSVSPQGEADARVKILRHRRGKTHASGAKRTTAANAVAARGAKRNAVLLTGHFCLAAPGSAPRSYPRRSPPGRRSFDMPHHCMR